MSFDAPRSKTRALRKTRSSFDLWQEHIRKSSALVQTETTPENDTVCVFRARGTRPPHEFAKKLGLAVGSHRL